jgi:hypothetical protein
LVVIGYRRKGGVSKARVEEILMLEAKPEMLETQVIPKTAEEMRAKLTRKGIT